MTTDSRVGSAAHTGRCTSCLRNNNCGQNGNASQFLHSVTTSPGQTASHHIHRPLRFEPIHWAQQPHGRSPHTSHLALPLPQPICLPFLPGSLRHPQSEQTKESQGVRKPLSHSLGLGQGLVLGLIIKDPRASPKAPPPPSCPCNRATSLLKTPPAPRWLKLQTSPVYRMLINFVSRSERWAVRGT